ncbi:MAG: shikimate kinase [Moorellales bacterium]
MGVGKTAVGRRLAAVLNKRFVDTDLEVERATGRSIPELFARYGEPRFREEEARVVAEVCRGRDQVIATGGGAVLRPENAAALRSSGVVIWLEAAPEVIYRRVGKGSGRPLLASGSARERIRELLAAREPYYRALAHFRVDTSGRSVEEVVAEILARLETLEGEPASLGEGSGR